MKRIKTALIILLLLLVVTVPCSAEESNYIISGKDKIPVSTSYINEAAISDFQGTLNSAQDIFIDENDSLSDRGERLASRVLHIVYRARQGG